MKMTRIYLAMLLTLVVAQRGIAEDKKQSAESPYPFSVAVRGEGHPMILIPGLACSGSVWDDTVKRFESQYQCHVLTLAGFAGEPPQPGPFIDNVRDGIARYIDEKKLVRPVIVGHSIGGFLAYELGIAVPDKVGPLISIDGLPFLPALVDEKVTEAQTKLFAPRIAQQMAGSPREDYLRQQKATVAMWISDPIKQAAVIQWGADSDQKTVGNAFAELYSRDLREKVAAIKSPVLLVAAPQAFGNITKDEARTRYSSQVNKISIKVVANAENSKHFVMYDEPEWLWKQIEEFLVPYRK